MAPSSPLSFISTPTSFYTANGSPSNGDETTDASSLHANVPSSPYRTARRLPRELREHCQIYLEEQLYHCAIHLLDSLLCAGASRRERHPAPALVPPPGQLALLCNLVVHPLHTNRATEKDRLEVASRALAYLRNLLSLVGPINADLKSAFQFDSRSWSRRTYRRLSDDDLSSGEDNGECDGIRGTLAGQNSLWRRTSDFWYVVGWAFNCSGRYPHRWKYWRIWLEFMLDVLDADWDERFRMDEEADHMGTKSPGTFHHVRNSMFFMYAKQQNPRLGGLKSILKAIFADGSEQYRLAFQEIFEKETKTAPLAGTKRKREKELDLANDKYGDYYDDESVSSSASEPPTPQKKPASKEGDDGISASMAESIPLRLRLFRLLSRASYYCGDQFVPVKDLYRDFATRLNNTPLPVFRRCISYHSSPLIRDSLVTLIKELLHYLLPNSYKDPAKVDPETEERDGVSYPILEQCYLVHSANTIAADDNAKVALLLENLTQILWYAGGLECSPSLRLAVQKGIKAREAKIKRKRGVRGAVDETDKLAIRIMENSTQRLLSIIDMLEDE